MSETREYPRMIDICSHSFSPRSGALVNEYANINVAVLSTSVTFGLIEVDRHRFSRSARESADGAHPASRAPSRDLAITAPRLLASAGC